MSANSNAEPLRPAFEALLGYLNFSTGKPDPRFQKQFIDVYAELETANAAQPWQAIREKLEQTLEELAADPDRPFRDVAQARAVISLVFDSILPAYRDHHRDLLLDFADENGFAPFFLVRAFESVLGQGGPWDEGDRIRNAALAQLNDYVGHRPVAILETRPRAEPYPHERVRPIPLYIRGAGVVGSRYHGLVSRALEILQDADPSILADAQFDPSRLDELAFDPRPYDQGHPAHRRPNYIFGEWDPDHIDQHGQYRRFVLRRVVLDALWERSKIDTEAELESAVVLAATILMASGIRGSGPGSHDSAATLATLMPKIARCRDAFYARTLETVQGLHGDRLRQEAQKSRQPFGRARQHLNEALATQRAGQLQHRHLALLFSAMGYPEASNAEAGRISVASVRMLSEIHSCLAQCLMAVEQGQLEVASTRLTEIENLIHRGIDCGALADPWNILGFQALFPLSPAREDSVRDTRIDDLVFVMEQCFQAYSRVICEAAASGQKSIVKELKPAMKELATWWDQFASIEVSDVRRVHGAEAVSSTKHVAKALGRWHQQGEATGDLAFWKQHLEGFRSPKAFASVIVALLDKKDYRAAMALLVNWVGQVEEVPLEDEPHSFHALALRWLLGVWKEGVDPALIPKFFDYLEANAGDYWQVPTLETERLPMPREKSDDEDELFAAAYEDVTYRDSTDDGTEGTVWDEGEPRKEFTLEAIAEPLGKHLRFHSALAQLWQVAVRGQMARARGEGSEPRGQEEMLGSWLGAARNNQRRLLTLLDTLHDHVIPEPSGSHESMVDYDRRRILKEHLLYAAIGTCLDTTLTAGAIRGAIGGAAPAGDTPRWQGIAIRLEAAIWRGDADEVRTLLPAFIERFRSEPLLFKALVDGGIARHILRARMAQSILRALVATLPRLGLLRETFDLLHTAHTMETANRPDGRGVSEFNTIFQIGFSAVAESVVAGMTGATDQELAEVLERFTGRFLKLWANYSQSLRLSSLDAIRTAAEWKELVGFVQRYGGDLFHARFMTLANLRGVLHRGVGAYLDYLTDNPDPLHPVRLIEDLDSAVPRAQAERCITIVLNALIENYEEYKDYNTSSAQSDYGENLSILLEFLRLKAAYEKQAWLFRPLYLAHEVLARKSRTDAAVLWEQGFTRLADQVAGRYVSEMNRLEELHGIRLRTISDRLNDRFVRPLALDRLCALIGQAMDGANLEEEDPSFQKLTEGLTAYTATPVGSGLDVPPWLRRLEAEVQRVQAARSAVTTLAEEQLRLPQRVLSKDELDRQLRAWGESPSA